MDWTQGRFTITFDQDPDTHTTIARATGTTSRWYRSGVAFAVDGDEDPIAVFVDVRLFLEQDDSGPLIPRLKDSWPLAPLILTAQSGESELLTEGMVLGADDFVAKPIDPDELLKRVKIRRTALARRAARETIAIGDMTIDTLQRSVSSPRGQQFLSPTEVKLISELAKAGGQVVARETLKARCWPQTRVSDNALNRKLYEIRRRLKPLSDNVNIRTIYGVGFIMEPKPPR